MISTAAHSGEQVVHVQFLTWKRLVTLTASEIVPAKHGSAASRDMTVKMLVPVPGSLEEIGILNDIP